MILFDIFSFKKEAGKIFTASNVNEVLGRARELIIDQVKAKIDGSKKKAAVDAVVLAKIDSITSGCSNKLVLWLVDQVKNFIPTVTQLIYNFLKEKVENL